MKKLITAADVKNYSEQQKDTIFIDTNTIITPAAKDAANESRIRFVVKEDSEKVHQTQKNNGISMEQVEALVKDIDTTHFSAKINPELVQKIVIEVMANLEKCKRSPEIIKLADPSGLRIVRGESVKLETFNTGIPQDNIKIKELLTLRESPNMSTGFMEMEQTVCEFNNKGEEISYIIQGTLECTINGNKYLARAGDVLYVPANSKVSYSAHEKVKYFYVTYPSGSKT